MTENDISNILKDSVPDDPETAGWGDRVRRAHRRRRIRALSGGAAVAIVAAFAVPLGMTLGGSGQQVATPAATPSNTTSSSHEGDGILCPPGDTTPGAALGDMTRGYACGPVGSPIPDSNESVQIPLSDDLVADLVGEAVSTQRPLEVPSTRPDVLPPPFPDNVPGLVLLGPDGAHVTMVGTPDGYNWRDPEHKEFTPSRDLADRIWAEIGANSNCSVPGYLYPPDVTVHVYDAGAGAASVTGVVEHLRNAGFAVTNSGKSEPVAPGGPIILRGANENWSGVTLVSSYLDALGPGEMSRQDDVVELLITSEFNDVRDPFASDPLIRVVGGSLTCTSPQEAPASTTSTTPVTKPVTTIAAPAPAPDPEASSDFLTAYTVEEQGLILQQVSGMLEGRDVKGFTVVVSRTTWVDGLAALSPDVEIVGADNTAAFALRVSGPFGETTVGGGPLGSGQPVEVVGTHALFGNDGKSFAFTQLHQVPGGSPVVMPAIDPSYEHDAAVIDLQQVNLPILDTAPPALTDDEQTAADNLLTTFKNLLPPEVEVTEVLNSSPDGAVLTLKGPDTNTRVTLALWHLSPGATGCPEPDCTAVQVDNGAVYIDASFDSPESPSRSYTYRRSDDAAIYFTMDAGAENNPGSAPLALALAQDQMIPLLTNPEWTPFLDRKKAEPPQ